MTATLDLDPTRVIALVREHYALDVLRLESFSGESATTCRITTADARYVFKAGIVATDAEAAQVRWQGAVIADLHRAGLSVQEPLPSLDGELTALSSVDGHSIAMQVFGWLDGDRVADVPMDAALLRDIGTTAARLATALDAVPVSPGPSSHSWDVRRSGEVLDTMLPLLDDHLASLCVRARDLFLAVDLTGLPSGTVHQDLNDFNLLASASPDGTMAISGILDFGDLLDGPKVAELAVAAAYAVRRTSDPLDALVAVVSGWSAVRPLTSQECSVIFPIAVARLAVNAAVWSARLASSRGEYGQARMGGSVEAIERCLALDPREVLNRVRGAASLSPVL
ncbi:MAG: phosphotransferase [Rhodoglobus sp.]